MSLMLRSCSLVDKLKILITLVKSAGFGYRGIMAKIRKKPHVYMEKVKLRHTTHWDMDYLSNEEVDVLYGLDSEDAPFAPQNIPQTTRKVRWPLIIGVGVALISALLVIGWHLMFR